MGSTNFALVAGPSTTGFCISIHGKGVAVLAHGLTKKGKVPKADIELVIRRRSALEDDPEKHIYEEHHGGQNPQDD